MHMAYYQDEYDKRFIRIVNYLLATREKHKQFNTQLELGKILGIATEGQLLSSIKNGTRGVPKDIRPQIDKILKEKFGITGQSNLSLELQEPPAVYNLQENSNNTALQDHIQTLKRNTAFIENLFEQNIKSMAINLEILLSNQRVQMAMDSVESLMAAERVYGADADRLKAELQKRDTLIGAALSKAQ
jgi:hypothetical protein